MHGNGWPLSCLLFSLSHPLLAWRVRLTILPPSPLQVFACNGSIDEDEEHGKILKLSGDQRKTISEFLAVEEIVPKQAIKVHGF